MLQLMLILLVALLSLGVSQPKGAQENPCMALGDENTGHSSRNMKNSRPPHGPWRHHVGNWHREGDICNYINELNLNESQHRDLRDIKQKFQPLIEAKRKAVMEAERALRDGVLKKVSTESDLRQLNQSASEAHFALILEHRTYAKEMENLLTSEQKAALEKHRQLHHTAGSSHGSTYEK